MTRTIKYVAFLYNRNDTDPNTVMHEIMDDAENVAMFDTTEQAIEVAAEGFQLVDNPDEYAMGLIEIEVFRSCAN